MQQDPPVLPVLPEPAPQAQQVPPALPALLVLPALPEPVPQAQQVQPALLVLPAPPGLKVQQVRQVQQVLRAQRVPLLRSYKHNKCPCAKHLIHPSTLIVGSTAPITAGVRFMCGKHCLFHDKRRR